MDPSSFGDVAKSASSAFYGALSGSVCFPMPLMYNPMNSYPFMSTPFLPVHHPMLSQHGVGLQESNHLLSSTGDLVSGAGDALNKSDDLGSRALAFLQTRYQGMNKCFLPSGNSRKQMNMTKYCLTQPSMLDLPGSTPPSPLFGKDKGSGRLGQSGQESDGLTAISPVSGTYPEKDCYLSSPATEVEEADSTGKCATEVVEQKVIPRWNCDLNETPTCPICGGTVSVSDLSEHFQVELHRLNDLIKKKEFLVQDEHSNEQISSMSSGREHLRLHPMYNDVEKRCPEFRKETYLRVRANRLSRLGVCSSRSKKQSIEEGKHSWKIHRTRQFCSPKLENCPEEVLTNGDMSAPPPAHQSMLMLELTVQQLAHRTEQRNEVMQEDAGPEKNNQIYQSSIVSNGETFPEEASKQGDGQAQADSSCNGFRSPEIGAFQSPRYTLELLRRCSSHGEENANPSGEVKCLVCMEPYKKPVVSICCWHVHCETCWLKSLGNKRVCPQCDAITSPSDLRRIHL